MIMTDELIRTTASENGFDIPESLRCWLLTEYETEPFDDFFLEEDLRSLIRMHYEAFLRGMFTPKPQDSVALWKNRYEGVCEILDEYRSLYLELSNDYDKAIELLDLNGIPH